MMCETWREAEGRTDPGTAFGDQMGIDLEVVGIGVGPCSVGPALDTNGATALRNLGSLAEALCRRPDIVTSEIVQTYQYVGIGQEGGGFEGKLGSPFENLSQGGCLSTKKQRVLLVGVPYSGDIRMADWDNHHIAVGPCEGFGLVSVRAGRIKAAR